MGIISGIININRQAIHPTQKYTLKECLSTYKPNRLKEFASNNAYLLEGERYLQKIQANFKNTVNFENLIIIADVRLDNRRDIEKQLGVEKNSRSNNDLILLLYVKFGANLLKHLVGAFAFVIFDKEKQQIFAARDQMGLKPFYYFFKDSCFVFGSEKMTILSLDVVDKQIDWQFVMKQFTSQMSVGDATEHANIKVLQPAHFLLIDKEGFKQQRYWDLDTSKEIIYKNDEDYILNFQQLMEEAIACRIADVDSVGSHLSGGLDSGGITGIAKVVCDRSGKPLSTFSYVYDEAIKSQLKQPDKNYDYIDIINQQIAFSNITNAYKISDPIIRNQYTCVQHEANLYGGLSWSENANTEYEKN